MITAAVKNIEDEVVSAEWIIENYSNLVHHIASRYLTRIKLYGFEYEDVVSEGYIGLVKAYRDFEPDRGLKFMTYAFPKVQGEIMKLFRDFNTGPRFPRTIKLLSFKIGRNDNPEEIAKKLEIPIKKAQVVFECKRNFYTVSGETIISSDGEKDTTVFGLYPSEQDVTHLFVNEFFEWLQLDKYGKRLTFILTGLMQGKAQKVIAKELGLSQVQVSRDLRRIRGLYESFEGGAVSV
ncbi:sigma-70 family RNA polymerase sigma factor [Bacillus cihuensis]|uniref:sigma-70 family RNA polymerase sigma factor n=1 Tax=Bacillus cihuensis TaxID=1208599 RepID=UPI000407CF0F|nr:sigma-70 family RNA polymerase sigma factor [Bacillus cihuensis]